MNTDFCRVFLSVTILGICCAAAVVISPAEKRELAAAVFSIAAIGIVIRQWVAGKYQKSS